LQTWKEELILTNNIEWLIHNVIIHGKRGIIEDKLVLLKAPYFYNG